jgi:hypothetical protein
VRHFVALHFVMATRPAFRNQPRYSPGQSAPASGVYRVHHGTGHREDHDLIVIRGEEFAACRSCKGVVQFTLKKQASYITDDFDFAGPMELPESPDYFKNRLAQAQLDLNRAHRDYAEDLQRRQRAQIAARQCGQAFHRVLKTA